MCKRTMDYFIYHESLFDIMSWAECEPSMTFIRRIRCNCFSTRSSSRRMSSVHCRRMSPATFSAKNVGLYSGNPMLSSRLCTC